MNKLLLATLAATVALLPSIGRAQMVNAQTGTTYTVANTDCDPAGAKLLTLNNAAAIAVTLPQAGASGLFLGGCRINIQNIGIGLATITPTTSTINSQTTITVPSGTSVKISNDSTPAATGNYWAQTGGATAGGVSPENFRNVVQNGDMAVQQRGAGERTGGTTTIPNTAYSADRWGCNANVTSGQAFCIALTTGPTGARGSQSVYRKSAALTQPVCMMQEIPSADFTPLAGQTVTLSFQAKALAGMIADNGGVMNAYIFTGTGSDQGLQSFTASPAITPAWTGIASSLTKAVTLTTSYQRFSYTAAIPGTATEGAVAFCFTPTASGAGTTDGFNFSQVQLEAGIYPTPFEVRPQTIEYAMAVQRYYRITESATAATVEGSSVSSTTSITNAFVKFPTAMVKVPTMSYATGFLASAQAASTSGFACTALTTSATVTGFGASTTGVLINCASSAAGPAAGTSGWFWDAGTGSPTGLIEAFADF